MGHSKRKHALLSASGASRWLNCTPSARLEDLFPDTSSVYAKEGTLAHEFAELRLLEIFEGVDIDSRLKKLRRNKLYTSEMEPQVSKYVDYCIEEHKLASRRADSVQISIEARLDFSHVVPNAFGTGDFSIASDEQLSVIDLKYGMNRVYAQDNPQLRLYALGALEKFDLLYDIHQIKMSIVQPRANHISESYISVEELKAWAEDIVKPAALAAHRGEGDKKVGPWCKYCRAKIKCAALAEDNLRIAKLTFAEDLGLLAETELIEAYEKTLQISDWLKSVYDYLLNEAAEGRSPAGYKLVQGKGKSRWSNPDRVEKILRDAGFDEAQIVSKKLAGLGAIGSLMSVDKFDELVGAYVFRPEGAPTLVPESDYRNALGLEQARLDFAEGI